MTFHLTFDGAKNVANIGKHGMSLKEAGQLRWEELLAWPDERHVYGEPRMAGLAPIGVRLYAVVYVDRGDIRRIISLRRANKRELARYVESHHQSR